MQVHLPYDRQQISINVPDQATILQTRYPSPQKSNAELVKNALQQPIHCAPLQALLKNRRDGKIVIVVSDVTRPIPYADFLYELLAEIENCDISPTEILILIATGMHRKSSWAERVEILGSAICAKYAIIDHDPEADDLVKLPEPSWAGNAVFLNRHFMQAGFRITTGLVEPHYMAGFSGGRKAVCPGLASLQSVQNFHGFEFLNSSQARIASLQNNPCHLESLSIAKLAQVDFSLNVIINHERQVMAAFAGEIEQAHLQACEFVKKCANPIIENEFDVIITSSAGYPLDATFYQCTKSFVCCLPAIKPGGTIISVGGCTEGIGSREYTDLLVHYAEDHRQFLHDIAQSDRVIKDQWQHQMHCRALDKVGKENIHFVTENITQENLAKLSVTAHATEHVQEKMQQLIDIYTQIGKRVCVIPEGPYCSPIAKE